MFVLVLLLCELVLVLEQQLQPVVLLLLAVGQHGEAVVLGVECDGEPVLAVRLLVDVEARVDVDAAFRGLAGAELLLAVVVLQSGRPAAARRTQHEALLLHRLKTAGR